MFTVSAKGVYGLSALVDLAGTFGTGPRQIKDIAEAHGIPQHYLEQILVNLKKAGIVESYRGASGGYSLAKPPAQIKLMDCLTALEGKLEVITDQRKENTLSFFWNGIEDAISERLGISLEGLFLEQQRNQQQLHYDI